MEVEEIKAVISDLERLFPNASQNAPEIEDRIAAIRRLSAALTTERPPISDSSTHYENVKNIGQHLWNLLVYCCARQDHSVGFLSMTTTLRELAIDLISYGYVVHADGGVSELIRSLEIAKLLLRAGKDWMTAEDTERALSLFDRAANVAAKPARLFFSSSDGASAPTSRVPDSFRRHVPKAIRVLHGIHLARLDALRILSRFDDAKRVAVTARSILASPLASPHLTDELERLSASQYNVGLALYRIRRYSLAAEFLLSAVETVDESSLSSPLHLGRLLRCLALTLLNSDRASDALRPIVRATSLEPREPRHLHVRAMVNLAIGDCSAALDVILDLLQLSAAKSSEGKAEESEGCLDLALDACSVAARRPGTVETFHRGMKLIVKRLSDASSLSDSATPSAAASTTSHFHIKALLCYLESLLGVGDVATPAASDVRAKAEVTALLSDIRNGRLQPSPRHMSQFHSLLWSAASNRREEREIRAALQWLQLCLPFLPADGKQERARVLSQVGRCHMELDEGRLALKALQDARSLDSNNAYVSFLLFEAMVRLGDERGASGELMRLRELPSFHSDYLAMAAQRAHDCGRLEVAADALEALLFSTTTVDGDTAIADEVAMAMDGDSANRPSGRLSGIEKGRIVQSLARLYADCIRSAMTSHASNDNSNRSQGPPSLGSADASGDVEMECQDGNPAEVEMTTPAAAPGAISSSSVVIGRWRTRLLALLRYANGLVQKKAVSVSSSSETSKGGLSALFNDKHEEEGRFLSLVAWNHSIACVRDSHFQLAYDLMLLASDFERASRRASSSSEQMDATPEGSSSLGVVRGDAILAHLRDLRNCYVVRVYCLTQIFETQNRNSNVLKTAVKELAACSNICAKIREVRHRMEPGEPRGQEASTDGEDVEMVEEGLPLSSSIQESANEEAARLFSLLLTFEFKTKLLLNTSDADLRQILRRATGKSASSRPSDYRIGQKGLQSIADLCIRYAPHFQVTQECLLECVEQAKSDAACPAEEVLDYFRRLVECAQAKAEQLTHLQGGLAYVRSLALPPGTVSPSLARLIVFFLARAWNNAVYFFKLQRIAKAERWGACAVQWTEAAKGVEAAEPYCKAVLRFYPQMLQGRGSEEGGSANDDDGMQETAAGRGGAGTGVDDDGDVPMES